MAQLPLTEFSIEALMDHLQQLAEENRRQSVKHPRCYVCAGSRPIVPSLQIPLCVNCAAWVTSPAGRTRQRWGT